MIDVYVNGTSIDVGRQGENLARNICFDLSDLIDTYGEGTATLVHMRPSDKAPYVCTVTRSDAFLIWAPTSTDTAYAGSGKCELRWVVGDTLAKSIVYNTSIAPSIMSAGQIPDPYLSWYDAMMDYIKNNYSESGAPQEVREAIFKLLSKAAYTETGLTDELATVEAWAAVNYTIRNNLTNVTTNNSTGIVVSGSSYTATLTANSGYTLGTVTVTMGGDDVTSTVYSHGVITIAEVTGDVVITASGVAGVASLSAVYTQSGTVYDTDALDTLKADLVVTATYSDSTTAVIPSTDYTLSGTLEAGTTSTITVSYGGKTATFDVTVSTHVLFEVTNRTMNKTDPCIDTGIELLETDRDFTILADFYQPSAIPSGTNNRLMFCANADTSWHGIFLGGPDGTGQYGLQWFAVDNHNVGFSRATSNARLLVAYRHTAGSDSATLQTKYNSNAVKTTTPNSTFIPVIDRTLTVGGATVLTPSSNWVGTINRFTLYDTVLTDDEVNAFFA